MQSDCLDYGSAGKLSAAALGAKQTGALRLACSFPKAPTVTVKRLPATGQARAGRSSRPRTIVAEATVTTHGSSLKYAAKYCTQEGGARRAVELSRRRPAAALSPRDAAAGSLRA